MILAGELAVKMGLFSRSGQKRQRKLIGAVGLKLRYNYPSSQLLSFMKRDKKARSGKLKFVLPLRIGRVQVFDNVSERLVCEVLEQSRGKGL
jgi:3-dehydroquinate synthase